MQVVRHERLADEMDAKLARAEKLNEISAPFLSALEKIKGEVVGALAVRRARKTLSAGTSPQ